ncbi:ParB/RepB/Spo0J family partition protein [Pseudomonadota bacterium]
MSAKKARLGRGLDALLGDALAAPSKKKDEMRSLPLELLQPGKYQPRSQMSNESLEDLAQSIKTQGIVQPILVRKLATGNYEIIAGERRWRAAQLAGIDEVPTVVRNIPDAAALAVALIENIQRENLSPIEEATGIRRLLDEFGMTHQQAAENVGRSRAAVTNLLRLLTLTKEAREYLASGKLDMGHARALLALSGADQVKTARTVVDKGLSVRETERLVRKVIEQAKSPVKSSGKKQPNADLVNLQEEISTRLGARVQILDSSGKGKLIIQYNSLDELDGILEKIH